MLPLLSMLIIYHACMMRISADGHLGILKLLLHILAAAYDSYVIEHHVIKPGFQYIYIQFLPTKLHIYIHLTLPVYI